MMRKRGIQKTAIVIRLGDFHTVMSFSSVIGMIFKDAGEHTFENAE